MKLRPVGEVIQKLSKMYDEVEQEYLKGDISEDERDVRQAEIMETWRVIQP